MSSGANSNPSLLTTCVEIFKTFFLCRCLLDRMLQSGTWRFIMWRTSFNRLTELVANKSGCFVVDDFALNSDQTWLSLFVVVFACVHFTSLCSVVLTFVFVSVLVFVSVFVLYLCFYEFYDSCMCTLHLSVLRRPPPFQFHNVSLHLCHLLSKWSPPK